MTRIVTDLHLLFSLIGAAIMAVLSWWPDSILFLWNMCPPEVKTRMPAEMVSSLGLIIFVISAASRLYKGK